MESTLINERGGKTLSLNISADMKMSYAKLPPTMIVAAYVGVLALTLVINVGGILVLRTGIESFAVYLDATHELIIKQATMTTVSKVQKSQT